jgi:hypothetical protein
MKKNVKSLLSVLGLVTVMAVALTFDVNSQETTPCVQEVIVVDGTKRNVNPEDEWNYECLGTFSDCTDVWVLGCPEQQ